MHICPKCKRSFIQRGNLNLHMNTHLLLPKTWICNYNNCTKKFTHKKNFYKHYNQIHNGINQCTLKSMKEIKKDINLVKTNTVNNSSSTLYIDNVINL